MPNKILYAGLMPAYITLELSSYGPPFPEEGDAYPVLQAYLSFTAPRADGLSHLLYPVEMSDNLRNLNVGEVQAFVNNWVNYARSINISAVLGMTAQDWLAMEGMEI